ncbi:flippase activity-associated protein Agl23 [Chloroflexota bacterium]
MATISKEEHWLTKQITSIIKLDIEKILLLGIILLAVVSRLYILGARVMSHDEINHVYFAWQYFNGSQYIHDPLSHGPLQFHLLYLSYFLFGVTDFSARIPAAIFSIATVFFAWKFRRYFGRTGGLVAALLMVVSPFMLYYGRYARNEAFVGFFGVATLWSLLRYLESGRSRYLYFLAAIFSLHFTTKETSFIYMAQALFFLGLVFVFRVSKQRWENRRHLQLFLLFLLATFICLGAAFGVRPQEAAVEAVEEAVSSPQGFIIFLVFAGVTFILSCVWLLVGFGLERLRRERSFEGILFLGLLTLPHLAAFPVSWIGWNPLGFRSFPGLWQNLGILLPLFLISIVIGVWWRPKVFLTSLGIFYAIFIPLYTSVFTNGYGFLSGMFGSLGYWLEQQAVERGSQPWYFYPLIQIPIYEFLGLIGTLLATGWGVAWLIRQMAQKTDPYQIEGEDEEENEVDLKSPWIEDDESGKLNKPAIKGYALALLIFWSFSSLMAYIFAGEKMPWLTLHIAWPMALVTGWVFGWLIEKVDWQAFQQKRGILTLIAFGALVTGLAALTSHLAGPIPPFQGQAAQQLRSTFDFMFALLAAAAGGGGLAYLLSDWDWRQGVRVLVLACLTGLAVITARSSYRASYINYDLATEYLVYAHAGRGPKDILKQVEQISEVSAGGNEIMIAYDNHSAYPFWWYLRDYPNQFGFGENPSRELRNYPIILVGESNYGKVEPIVGQAYYEYEYIRMWWPNQDYFTLSILGESLKNPETRFIMLRAMFQIWFNRDYGLYAEILNKDMGLQRWLPANKMRMYVRKDILSEVWQYGAPMVNEEIFVDPYENSFQLLLPANTIGHYSEAGVLFDGPHDIALAPDGSIYVADTNSHAVLHLSKDGELLHQWGGFGSVEGEQPGTMPGLFNQPWGIAVDQEGYVYVADTWNHRIQKFTAEGEFITTWGVLGQGEDAFALYGPRDVEVDGDGNVIITDTGNKRVLVFDPDGNFVSRFGGFGFENGLFDEPVGLAVDLDNGLLYVADTWNQRVQVFESKPGGAYIYLREWEIFGWYGQNLENKPYLAVLENGDVAVGDPEGGRIMIFNLSGELKFVFGDSVEQDVFSVVSGLTGDLDGGMWVTDSQLNLLFYFRLPE